VAASAGMSAAIADVDAATAFELYFKLHPQADK
jgi:hypothetical protein